MMLDYLRMYNLTDTEINNLKNRLNTNILNKFEFYRENVISVLNYLKEQGVKNIGDVILYRPDLCFEDLPVVIEKVNKYDKNLILFVFNNDIEDLTNLNI